jgi:cardiolipin synthase
MDSEIYKVLSIYKNGDHYLEDLLIAISQAQHSVYVESYIFELPEPGERILPLLKEKQQQGLDVRLMVDGIGSLHHVSDLQKWSEDSWVPFRVYNPLPWRRRWRVLFFPIFLLHLLATVRVLNRRDHRKMVIIDKDIAFLGSINFARVHFSALSPQPWYDLAVQVKGEAVRVLERAFLLEFSRLKPSRQDLWRELRSALRHRTSWFPMPHPIRLNHHFLLRFLFWRDLLRRIRHARDRVYIMNAYFVPHRTLMRSLRVAAERGVEVIVVLPSESDVPVVKWFAPIYYRRLMEKGVQIREMQGQMIHSKSVIIDNWSLIGSNNLNYRSLIHDLEVEAVIEDSEMLQRLLEIWDEILAKSHSVFPDEVVRLSWIGWLRYRFVLLIRYFV